MLGNSLFWIERPGRTDLPARHLSSVVIICAFYRSERIGVTARIGEVITLITTLFVAIVLYSNCNNMGDEKYSGCRKFHSMASFR